jgi:hypothetical protein
MGLQVSPVEVYTVTLQGENSSTVRPIQPCAPGRAHYSIAGVAYVVSFSTKRSNAPVDTTRLWETPSHSHHDPQPHPARCCGPQLAEQRSLITKPESVRNICGRTSPAVRRTQAPEALRQAVYQLGLACATPSPRRASCVAAPLTQQRVPPALGLYRSTRSRAASTGPHAQQERFAVLRDPIARGPSAAVRWLRRVVAVRAAYVHVITGLASRLPRACNSSRRPHRGHRVDVARTPPPVSGSSG